MIFPHRTDRKIKTSHSNFSKGFTLLEIVIVLAISALIIGGSIATVILTSSERKLREASSEVELLAKKAHTASLLHQTPYAIEFHPGFVKLLLLSQSGDIERTTALGNAIGGTESDSESKPELNEQISIDSEIELSIRHWNTEKFLTPTQNNIPIWRFDPDGLCEPLTVRFTLGESYAQDTYHPLTATIADSELEAK